MMHQSAPLPRGGPADAFLPDCIHCVKRMQHTPQSYTSLPPQLRDLQPTLCKVFPQPLELSQTLPSRYCFALRAHSPSQRNAPSVISFAGSPRLRNNNARYGSTFWSHHPFVLVCVPSFRLRQDLRANLQSYRSFNPQPVLRYSTDDIMGRKTRFVAFDWSAKSTDVPNMPSSSATPAAQLELTSNQAQLTVTDPPLRERTANASRSLSASLGLLRGKSPYGSSKEIGAMYRQSDVGGLARPRHDAERIKEKLGATSDHAINARDASILGGLSTVNTLLRPSPSFFAAVGNLQQGFEKLSLCHDGSQTSSTSLNIPTSLCPRIAVTSNSMDESTSLVARDSESTSLVARDSEATVTHGSTLAS
jgi:hypothetical protein